MQVYLVRRERCWIESFVGKPAGHACLAATADVHHVGEIVTADIETGSTPPFLRRAVRLAGHACIAATADVHHVGQCDIAGIATCLRCTPCLRRAVRLGSHACLLATADVHHVGQRDNAGTATI